MTLIVNLSTTHDYSIQQTVGAFVRLCKEHNQGCLKSMPGFFEDSYNYLWVMTQYQLNYKELIEPYKLGKNSTHEFLENLSKIFPFMNDLNKEDRHELLAKAWNASIQIGDKHDRFKYLAERAKEEPVYLISNTNELNVQGIMKLFSETFAELKLNLKADINITHSQKPVEILPNVFLCLSYRYGSFKTQLPSTTSLLDTLVKQTSDSVSVVSQYSGDLERAKELGVANVMKPEDFYGSSNQLSLDKKSL